MPPDYLAARRAGASVALCLAALPALAVPKRRGKSGALAVLSVEDGGGLVALGVRLQTSVEFCSRPFLPPFMFKTKEETGRSGTPSKLVRMPPLTESMRPTTSTATGW